MKAGGFPPALMADGSWLMAKTSHLRRNRWSVVCGVLQTLIERLVSPRSEERGYTDFALQTMLRHFALSFGL